MVTKLLLSDINIKHGKQQQQQQRNKRGLIYLCLFHFTKSYLKTSQSTVLDATATEKRMRTSGKSRMDLIDLARTFIEKHRNGIRHTQRIHGSLVYLPIKLP